MRLRSFIARDMAEALAMVRREMGGDAIIVSSEATQGGNLEVRAAIEDGPAPEPAPQSGLQEAVLPPAERTVMSAPPPELDAALSWHGAPAALAGELMRAAAALGGDEPVPALALALETRFSFRPVHLHGEAGVRRPVMLVGAPGAGKSSACGKLAARAALAGVTVRLICADGLRAGAQAQAQAYAEAAGAEFVFAPDPASLRAALTPGVLSIIDAPAANPCDDDDLTMLLRLAQAGSAEPVLALDAGARAEEAASMARAFARIGARRLILTKLDAVRRKGAVLAAAAGGLAFAQVSASPFLVGGFAPATPLRLARLLLEAPEPEGAMQRPGADVAA